MPLSRLLLATVLASFPARAAEVVWLGPPPAEDQMVRAQAGAMGGPLTELDLRAAATKATQADDTAYDRLQQTLEDVRKYETELDGEKIIMSDLVGPIDGIGLMRNDDDRSAVFGALAYQGFAVDRYWGPDLGTAEGAESFRVEHNGLFLVGPWTQAIALEPDRDVTPYEIAEAPQRVAYGKTRQGYGDALPGTLVPTDVPAGQFLVDGRPTQMSVSGTVRVFPGTHWAHIERNGAVIERWKVTVEPGGRATLEPSLTDDAWSSWLDGVRAGSNPAPPEGLRPSLEQMGGEVWLATGTGNSLRAWKVTVDAVTEVKLERPTTGGDDDGGGMSLAVGLGGGWLGSQDFYYQDPRNTEPDFGTVNAMMTAVTVSADMDMGIARAGVGADLLMTMGGVHQVRYGADGETSFRPHPYISGGLKYAQLTVGYLFPHHLAFGARLDVPLFAGLELRVSSQLGVATVDAPADGTWRGLPVATGWAAAAWRF